VIKTIIFLAVIVVPFIYVMVKDYRVIKNELKNNLISIFFPYPIS
jgi:hypothetical protein